ncbi:hypothetical protein FIC_02277 [Flavobacteriaceae bacterium 3519-10]|nr:hypothetical protein FIC_02277 [Flavobacteriaceae bacterium 3519-10]
MLAPFPAFTTRFPHVRNSIRGVMLYENTKHFVELISAADIPADFEIFFRHFIESRLLIIFVGMRDINAVLFSKRYNRNKKYRDVASEDFHFRIHLKTVFIDFHGFLPDHFSGITCNEKHRYTLSLTK